jgi:O-antigen ligase
VAVGAVLFVATASPELRARYLSTFSADEDYNAPSSEGRLEIWKRGMGYMLQRPVTGVGVGAFGVAEGTLAGKAERGTSVRFTAAHNSLVQISAELGILGMVTFCTVVALTLRGAYRTRRRAVAWQRSARGTASDLAVTSATAVLTALAGLLTCATFLSFAYHPLLWYSFALCVGVEVANERRLAAARTSTASPGGWVPAFLGGRPGMRGGLAAGVPGVPQPSSGPT